MLQVRVLILILFVSNFTFGQNACDHIFTGQVIDNHDDQPLVGAVVKLGEKVAVTNHDGIFAFTEVCHETYDLSIQHISCDNLNEQITIDSSSSNKTFYLEHHDELLEEIEVETSHQRGQHSKSVNTLHSEDFEENQGKTFGELLEDVNGVTLLKSGATITKPIINGLHSQRILLVNNGMRMEGQQWGLEHAPEIDPNAVQTVSVIQGAGSVEFGADAIGGVITVEPTRLPDYYGIEKTIAVGANSNGRSGNVSANIVGKQKILGLPLSFQAHGSLKRAGNLRTPNYFLDNTSLEEANFMLRGGYLGDKFGIEANTSIFDTNIGILTDSHVGTVDGVRAIIANGQPFLDRGFSYDIGRPRQEILHEINQAKSYYYSSIGKIEFNVSRQYNEREEFDFNDEVAGLNLKTETFTEDLSLGHSFNDRWVGKVGVQLQQQDYRFDGFFLVPEYQQNSIGAYIFEEYSVNDNLLLEAGIRYDFKEYDYQIPFTEFEEINQGEVIFDSVDDDIGNINNQFNDLITGSIGAVLQLSDMFSLRPNFGYGVRQPLPNELFSDGLHNGIARWEVGDPTLTTEKATTFQLNADLNLGNTIANVSTYFNRIDDYIYSIPDPELDIRFTIRGSFPIFRTSQTDARIFGTNYQFSRTFLDDKLDFSTGGSLIWARDVGLDQPLIFIPSHRFNHQAKYQFNNQLFGTINFQNVLEQTRVPAQDVVPDFAPPPPAYSLVDLGVGYNAQLLGNKVSILGSVENATNNEFRDYLDRYRFFAHAPGINLGVRINYNF